jgi:hypothetical protein
MKSKSIAVLIGVLVSLSVSAQIKTPGIIIGGDLFYAKPSGKFTNTHNYGYGAEAFAGASLGKTYLVATVGTANFKAFNEGDGDISYTPIKAGVRRYFLLKKIFINADAGVAILKNKTTNETERRLLRGVGAGVRLFGFEGGVYYDGWKALNTSGFSNSVQWKVGYAIVI